MFEADHQKGRRSRGLRERSWASRLAVLLLLALLALLAFQTARLIWALISPAGPVGPAKVNIRSGAAVVAGFDPFFRLQASSASSAVTSLPLKLFGTRRDSATGLGSAIIATPDGIQSSYAVGEAVLPGVKLWSVGSDEVTIDRGGAKERLFLDQSIPAPVAAPPVSGTSAVGVRSLDRNSIPITPVTVQPPAAPPPPAAPSQEAPSENTTQTLEQQ